MSAPALSPKQIWSITASTTRKLALWVGAVSAGKTIASLFAFLIAVRASRGVGLIVIVGKTLQTIERNILDPLQDPTLFGALAKQVVHTRGSGTATILGREVHLVGANDVRAEEKIRGATVEIAYVDEATLLPDGFWEMLLTRLRTPVSRLLATTNPGAFNHWLRRDYMLQAEAKNLIVFHFTMDDNPSLTAEYVRDMKASFAGIFYERFILGKWTNAEGAILDMWDPRQHVVPWADLPPMHRLLAVGVDFGTTHASAALLLGLAHDVDQYGRRTGSRLFLVDEWRYEAPTAQARLTNAQQSAAFRSWLKSPHLPNGQHLDVEHVFVDHAAASFSVQLQSEGVVTANADKDVSYGIGLMSSLIAAGRLQVSDRCAGFIFEAPSYRWDPKATEKGKDEPVKVADDSLDAARYAITTSESIWRPLVGFH